MTSAMTTVRTVMATGTTNFQDRLNRITDTRSDQDLETTMRDRMDSEPVPQAMTPTIINFHLATDSATTTGAMIISIGPAKMADSGQIEMGPISIEGATGAHDETSIMIKAVVSEETMTTIEGIIKGANSDLRETTGLLMGEIETMTGLSADTITEGEMMTMAIKDSITTEILAGEIKEMMDLKKGKDLHWFVTIVRNLVTLQETVKMKRKRGLQDNSIIVIISMEPIGMEATDLTIEMVVDLEEIMTMIKAVVSEETTTMMDSKVVPHRGTTKRVENHLGKTRIILGKMPGKIRMIKVEAGMMTKERQIRQPLLRAGMKKKQIIRKKKMQEVMINGAITRMSQIKMLLISEKMRKLQIMTVAIIGTDFWNLIRNGRIKLYDSLRNFRK